MTKKKMTPSKSKRKAPRKAAVKKPGELPMADGVKVHCAHDRVVHRSELRPNPSNPNKHPAAQIALLAKIIGAQGWRAPITVSNRSGLIVRGHGRLEAADLLRKTACPVDFQDYDSDAEEWADLLADNRIAELAELDLDMTADILKDLSTELPDLDITGFDAEAFGEMTKDVNFNPNDDDADQPNLGSAKTHTCPECGHAWQN